MGEDLKKFLKQQRDGLGRRNLPPPAIEVILPRREETRSTATPAGPMPIKGRPPGAAARQDRITFSLRMRRDLLERLRLQSESSGLHQCEILEAALDYYFARSS